MILDALAVGLGVVLFVAPLGLALGALVWSVVAIKRSGL